MTPNGKSRIVFRKRGKRYTRKEFNRKQKEAGVFYYLYDKGIRDPKDQTNLVKAYAIAKGWETEDTTHVDICILIQSDFTSFLTWFHCTIKKDNNEKIHNDPTSHSAGK